MMHRVIGSTMAAESAAALDRQLHVRLLLDSTLLGDHQGGTDWRSRVGIPQIMVTDAKSLYDHLQKTRSIPKDRFVVDNTVVKMKWFL